MSEAYIYLAQPNYGAIVPEAIASLGMPSQLHRVKLRPSTASLLPHNFNLLWCDAVNGRKAHGYTHFAMHHSDIGSVPGWLDVLVEQMEQAGADVLSTLVAIKDQRGLTSAGVRFTDDQTIRRLTMREAHNLAPTFNSSVLQSTWGGRPCHLVVNTGLWVARLDRPWVEQFPGFDNPSRVLRLPDGTLRAVTTPEDWHASDWWAKNGVSVWLTRAVVARHYGRAEWSNNVPWGEWDQDRGDGHA